MLNSFRALSCLSLIAVSPVMLPMSSAVALPDARWRCKMNGDIPMGTLTVSGSSYQFVVARNSLWEQKPGDPGNGSGEYSESGNVVTPLSGPLATVYKVIGETAPGTDGSPVIYFAEGNGGLALFACWQG